MKEKEKNIDKAFPLMSNQVLVPSSGVCSAQQWLRQIPAPRKGRKSREWESGIRPLPDEASIRLWITLYSTALIQDEKSHKQLQIGISICPDESSFGFCAHHFSCPDRVYIWSSAGIYCLGEGTESACKYSSVGCLTLLQWHKENMRFVLNTQFSMTIQIQPIPIIILCETSSDLFFSFSNSSESS